MSASSEGEKKRNIALLYTLFTGDKNPPKDIKSFKDIPLHSFSDDIECDNMDSIIPLKKGLLLKVGVHILTRGKITFVFFD